MCGEHAIGDDEPVEIPGSSPHVRGARGVMVLTLGTEGIIPACAGSTGDERVEPHHRGDHPRMCGEHEQADAETLKLAGSSPHVRGARQSTQETCLTQGIIPACAGSTLFCAADSWRNRDHPRMCGEHHLA